MNPIIKFTTLFGLLAVELAIELDRTTSAVVAVLFFAISVVFVYRSFYAMRIRTEEAREMETSPLKARAADAR
jgi:K(+)-stimulated pyrophosphate-energized sodium pump